MKLDTTIFNVKSPSNGEYVVRLIIDEDTNKFEELELMDDLKINKNHHFTVAKITGHFDLETFNIHGDILYAKYRTSLTDALTIISNMFDIPIVEFDDIRNKILI